MADDPKIDKMEEMLTTLSPHTIPTLVEIRLAASDSWLGLGLPNPQPGGGRGAHVVFQWQPESEKYLVFEASEPGKVMLLTYTEMEALVEEAGFRGCRAEMVIEGERLVL